MQDNYFRQCYIIKIMKKVSIVVIAICALLCSCKKECLKEEREWAQDHLVEYENSNRERLASLPWTRQRIVYSELSPEKKVQLWREKAEKVKAEGKYPPEVIAEFEEMVRLLTPSYYLDENSPEKERFILITEQWETRLREVFMLSDLEIQFLYYKWVTMEEFFEAKDLDRPVETKVGPSLPEHGDDPLCECSDGTDCINLKCGIYHTNCRVPKDKSCGQYGAYVCNHMCT